MKVFVIITLIFALTIIFASVFSDTTKASDDAVSFVDLNKYSGNWYEIARYPNRFQKQCVGNTTANYRLKQNGDIEVINRCKKKDGSYDDATGKAKVVDKTSNAKLKVSFFWVFYAPYWIIDLDPNYKWAVIGHPKKSYCWILSRTPQLDERTYQGILKRLEAKGYDTAKLIKTPQN